MEYKYDYFVSYAHDDDIPPEGQKVGFVSEFVRKIKENEEFYKLFKKAPRVFFDKSTLRGMDDWNAKIREGIAGARFFIAMVSPNYFKSEFCKYEFDWWVSREAQRQLVGEDAAPMQIVKIPGLFPTKEHPDSEMPPEFRIANGRQIRNLRRYQSPDKFDLSDLEYAKIDEALCELKTQSYERVYKQNAAGRSPLGGRYPKHNKNFVGRRENLDKLRKDLATAQVAALSAVNGLGGIGKTALALTYGHAFAWDYELGRVFVPCEGQTSLRSAILSANLDELIDWTRLEGNEERQYKQFWQILKNKHAEIVKRNKAEGRDPNLGASLYLILDNATSSDIVSEEELAQLPDFVHAVATTRESLDQFSNIEGQTLDALSEEEALELLDNLRPFKADSNDREAALEIVKLLGGLALDVEIVGSYLRQKKFETYRKYADRLRADLLKVLDKTTLTKGLKLKDHQVELVENVLAPTLAALSENAQNLLKVASLFSPDAIPIPWLGELSQLDDADEGLFELENFGLLTPLDSTQKGEICNTTLARLHRLAREQIRATLPQEFCDMIKQVIRNKSKETLESDSNTFFQLNADWSLTAIFEFYLELISDRKGSTPSEIDGNLIWTFGILGQLFIRLGRMTQARTVFSGGVAICKRLTEVKPDNLATRRELSVFYNDLGNLERAEGDTKKARDYYLDSLAIRWRLAGATPNDIQAQRDLSISFERLGDLENVEGDANKAREYYQESLAIRLRLADAMPNDVQAQRDLSISFECSGDLERAEGDTKKARKYYEDDLKIVRRLANVLPNDVQAQRDLSVSFERLGDLESAEGEAKKAREYYQNSLEIWQKLIQIVPNDIQIQRGVCIPLSRLSDLERAEGDTKKARECYLDSLEIVRRLAEALPKDVQVQKDLSIFFERLGDLERMEGDAKKAREYYLDDLEIVRHLAEALPNDVQVQRGLVVSYLKIGGLSVVENDFNAARDYFLLALKPATRNFELVPSFVQFRDDLVVAYNILALVETELGNVEVAATYLQKAVELEKE